MLPMVLTPACPARQRERAGQEALERGALGHRLSRTSRMNSPAQQQRVAIARAIINQPAFAKAENGLAALDSQHHPQEVLAMLR